MINYSSLIQIENLLKLFYGHLKISIKLINTLNRMTF